MTSPSRRDRLLFLALIAVLALSACAPTYNWRELRPEGTGLQLLFACRPSTAERRVPLAGITVKLTVQSCEAGKLTWGLSYADMGEPGRVGDALIALQAAAAHNIGAPATTPIGQAVPGSTPQARSGRMSLEGRRPDGAPVQMHVLFFARGTWVFQASAIGDAGPREAIDTFLGSARFSR